MTTTIKVRTGRQIDGSPTPVMVFTGGPFSGLAMTVKEVLYLTAALAGTADAIAEEDTTQPGWKPRTIILGDVYGEKAPDPKQSGRVDHPASGGGAV